MTRRFAITTPKARVHATTGHQSQIHRQTTVLHTTPTPRWLYTLDAPKNDQRPYGMVFADKLLVQAHGLPVELPHRRDGAWSSQLIACPGRRWNAAAAYLGAAAYSRVLPGRSPPVPGRGRL